MTDFASGVPQYLLLIVVLNNATFEYTTPLALIGGSLRIKLHSSSVRTNRANVLESSCIWSTTCFPPNKATLSLVILNNFSATYMLGGIFQLISTSVSETGIVSDGSTDTRTAGGKIIIARR